MMVCTSSYVLYKCLFDPTPIQEQFVTSETSFDESDKIRFLEKEVNRLKEKNKELSKENILHNIVDSIADKSVRMTVRSVKPLSYFEDPSEQFNQFFT